MTNLHQAFIDFDSKIKLTKKKKEELLHRRDVVRDKIRKYFKDELKLNQPKFMSQGSFTINTALNPIGDNEVDIDDGIYLQHLLENETTWSTPKEAHKLITDALEAHTKDGCKDKTSCVRLIYAGDFHIDLPIYVMKKNHAKLADIELNKWIASDSKEFKDWFYKYRENEQTNRVIRYLKAWRDYRRFDFSSIELTILAVNNFCKDELDDVALHNTLNKCLQSLNKNSKILKPVSPYEDLWKNYSKEKNNH